MPRGGVKGNSGGKKGRSGRKSKAEEMGLKALLDECFTVEDRKDVLLALVKEARRTPITNMEAVKLLLAYTFGRPVERHEVTGAEGESLLEPLSAALEKVYGNRN